MVKPKSKSKRLRSRSRSRSRSRTYKYGGAGAKPAVTKAMLTKMLNGQTLKPKKSKSYKKGDSTTSDWAAADARGMVVKGDGSSGQDNK